MFISFDIGPLLKIDASELMKVLHTMTGSIDTTNKFFKQNFPPLHKTTMQNKTDIDVLKEHFPEHAHKIKRLTTKMRDIEHNEAQNDEKMRQINKLVSSLFVEFTELEEGQTSANDALDELKNEQKDLAQVTA